MQKRLKKTRLLLVGSLLVALWGGAASHGNTLSVTNGNFADTNGLTETGGGWLGGVPAGWSTTAPDSGYAILQLGVTNYANLNTLGRSTNGFSPLRQNLGILSSTSDVTISFKATSLNPNPYYLASAIYSTTNETTPLGLFQTPALIQGPATITYSARNVPAGTELFVAFWTLGGYAPGITDVTVSTSSVAAGIALNSGAVLEIDPAQPVSSSLNFEFDPGSKIKVVGASPPTGSAVRLLYTSGVVSGTPGLEAAVSGYELALGGSNLLWLRKGVTIYNGDFQDTTGLTTNMAGFWYGGVPAGWEGANGSFSVREFSGDRVANLDVLSTTSPSFVAFRQSAGLLDSSGIVTLTFDVADLSTGLNMSAGIFDTQNSTNYSDWIALALPPTSITTTGLQTLSTAAPIAGGTYIGVAFWASSGAPGIDDVALSITYANRAPTEISLSGASILENNLVGDVVGTLSATDPDAGDSHSFSLVSGDGATGNASFEIEGNTLKAKVVFDHEAQASYSIRVQSTDAGGLSFEKTFTVTVTDVSEQTPQQAYLASFGLSGNDLLGTADPDGDGMDNSAEFAFGTSPVSGASRAATLSSGTGQIKLTYLQRKSGVTYTVKSLPNLTTAFDSGTTVTPSLSDDQANLPSADYERYEATLSTGSSRGFLRVKAVQ
jgi:VCBS repeat-containing protein